MQVVIISVTAIGQYAGKRLKKKKKKKNNTEMKDR